MDMTSWKSQICAAWVLIVALIGFAVGPTSTAGWTLVVAAAMTLPGLVVRFWPQPEPSMSESIRNALR